MSEEAKQFIIRFIHL